VIAAQSPHSTMMAPNVIPASRINVVKTSSPGEDPTGMSTVWRLRAALEDAGAVWIGAAPEVEGIWPSAEATPPKRVDANAQTCRIPDTSDGRLVEFSTSV